jgi:hypothetical protein
VPSLIPDGLPVSHRKAAYERLLKQIIDGRTWYLSSEELPASRLSVRQRLYEHCAMHGWKIQTRFDHEGGIYVKVDRLDTPA